MAYNPPKIISVDSFDVSQVIDLNGSNFDMDSKKIQTVASFPLTMNLVMMIIQTTLFDHREERDKQSSCHGLGRATGGEEAFW